MPKIIFAGTVRDCAPYLPRVLANIESLSSSFDEVACVFVENDSVDSTRSLLSEWGTGRPHFKLFDLAGLGQLPVRTLRLEFARNVYLEYVRSEPTLQHFEYLCILDMDDVGAYPVDVSQFKTALEFVERTESCAGVFANRLGAYFDLWALRHPELCPQDVWYEVLAWTHRFGTSDEEAFEQTFAKRVCSFSTHLPPFEVESAFGGLGLYRLDYVRRNPNPYLGSHVRVMRKHNGQLMTFRMQACEHVHFHAGLRLLGGRLFVFPALINGVSTLNPGKKPYSAYRSLCF